MCLLSDLGLPDGDGLDLVTKTKAIQPKLKAIALTARESVYRLGQRAGFDYYLTKPFDFHELRSVLAVCVNRRRRRASESRGVFGPH